MDSKQLLVQEAETTIIELNTENVLPGIYVIEVIRNMEESELFKIVIVE